MKKTVIASTLAVSLGIAGYGLSGHEAHAVAPPETLSPDLATASTAISLVNPFPLTPLKRTCTTLADSATDADAHGDV